MSHSPKMESFSIAFRVTPYFITKTEPCVWKGFSKAFTATPSFVTKTEACVLVIVHVKYVLCETRNNWPHRGYLICLTALHESRNYMDEEGQDRCKQNEAQ